MNRREFVDQPQALGGDAVRDFFIETEAASGSPSPTSSRAPTTPSVDPVQRTRQRQSDHRPSDFFPAGLVAFSGGNILLGGGGSDIITGGGGNDIIDGDAWLHVGADQPYGRRQIIREILFDQANGPTFNPDPMPIPAPAISIQRCS